MTRKKVPFTGKSTREIVEMTRRGLTISFAGEDVEITYCSNETRLAVDREPEKIYAVERWFGYKKVFEGRNGMCDGKVYFDGHTSQ